MGFAASLNIEPASPSQQSHSQSRRRRSSERFLILSPERSNYFYASEAERVATSLCALGYDVELASLRSLSAASKLAKYDRALFFNLCDILVDFGGDRSALFAAVKRIKAVSTECSLVLLESLRTKWFADNLELFQKAELDYIVDFGYFDQAHFCPPEFRARYLHLFNGLSQTEKEIVRQQFTPAEQRPIPWAFIGHQTPARASFAVELARRFDPLGLVYLPELSLVRKDGPHINETQIKRILSITRYYICYSHLTHYYLEAIRFRSAVLAGALPVKIFTEKPDSDENLFPYLHLREDEAVSALTEMAFEVLRDRLVEEMLRLPALEHGLLAVFCSSDQTAATIEAVP